MFPEGHHGQYFWISSSNGVWKWCIGPQSNLNGIVETKVYWWVHEVVERWEIKGIKLKEVYMVNF